MKINTPSKRRTIILTATIGAVLLISGILFAIQYNNNDKLSNQELTEAADKTSAVQPNQVENTETTNKGAELPSKSPSVNQEVDTDKHVSINGTPEKPQISRAGQRGDTIKVVALFQQESPGYCELQLNKANAQTIRSTSNITIGPSYYVCSLQVSRSQLPVGGQWKAVVVHHIGSTSTTSDESTVEVSK